MSIGRNAVAVLGIASATLTAAAPSTEAVAGARWRLDDQVSQPQRLVLCFGTEGRNVSLECRVSANSERVTGTSRGLGQ